MNVLVIDGEADHAYLIQKMLEKYGHEAHLYSETYPETSWTHYDLIILDTWKIHQEPDTIEKIVQSQAVICLTSTLSESQQSDTIKEIKYHMFLQKPFTMETIADLVASSKPSQKP